MVEFPGVLNARALGAPRPTDIPHLQGRVPRTLVETLQQHVLGVRGTRLNSTTDAGALMEGRRLKQYPRLCDVTGLFKEAYGRTPTVQEAAELAGRLEFPQHSEWAHASALDAVGALPPAVAGQLHIFRRFPHSPEAQHLAWNAEHTDDPAKARLFAELAGLRDRISAPSERLDRAVPGLRQPSVPASLATRYGATPTEPVSPEAARVVLAHVISGKGPTWSDLSFALQRPPDLRELAIIDVDNGLSGAERAELRVATLYGELPARARALAIREMRRDNIHAQTAAARAGVANKDYFDVWEPAPKPLDSSERALLKGYSEFREGHGAKRVRAATLVQKEAQGKLSLRGHLTLKAYRRFGLYRPELVEEFVNVHLAAANQNTTSVSDKRLKDTASRWHKLIGYHPEYPALLEEKERDGRARLSKLELEELEALEAPTMKARNGFYALRTARMDALNAKGDARTSRETDSLTELKALKLARQRDPADRRQTLVEKAVNLGFLSGEKRATFEALRQDPTRPELAHLLRAAQLGVLSPAQALMLEALWRYPALEEGAERRAFLQLLLSPTSS